MMISSDLTRATYVQAWECTGGPFSGYVYDQDIAIDKMALGCNIMAVTIIRYDDGAREFLKGTLAAYVKAEREYRAT
jgi:hypothetical protein